jgi:DNA repair exonuclease SbcCD ATPase subunit
MSLEDSELKIGGQTFKGAWIMVVLAIGSTIGGGVWTASSLYSRLEAVESTVIPDIVPLEEKVLLIEQELKANDVGQLQGKLATLGTNLVTISTQQDKLLLIKDNVSELKQSVTEMQTTVQKAEIVTKEIEDFKNDINTVKREIQDIWDGMDYLSNPLN